MYKRQGLRRGCKESIEVEGLQGVNFSLNGVVGGEVKASRVFRKDESAFSIYLEDDMSANKFPWVFSALHRWCSSCELMSSAYFESERYIAVSYTHLDVYKRQERDSVFTFERLLPSPLSNLVNNFYFKAL